MNKKRKLANFQKEKLRPSAKFSLYGIIVMMVFLVLLITVGYGAMATELNISGEAVFRVEADVRIVDARFLNGENGGREQYNVNFSTDTIIAGINLPNLDSTVTFEITVTNFTTIEMMLREINNLNMTNSTITYRIEGIALNDEIDGMESATFQITFFYRDNVTELPENTELEARIEFVFTILDIEPPVFTEIPGPRIFFITQADQIDLGSMMSAYDDVDGDVTANITYTTNLNLSNPTPGRFRVTYNVSDQAGNQAVPRVIYITIWNFVQIASGQNNSLALTSHGEVWTWGANDMGQRGQGVTGNSNSEALRVPTPIPQEFFGNLPVTQIASGQNTAYAVNSAGHIYAWGNNGSNRIGDGTTTNRNRPVRTGSSVNMTFTKVDSQWSAAAALGTDGNIWTWGDQSGTGALGQGNTTANRSSPVQITTTGNFVDVAIGRFGGAAVTDDGRVYVWGSNLHGQLGTGLVNAETAANRFPPREVPDLENIIRVDYGERHIVALCADGYVYGWGQGSAGRLGNNQAIANITIPRRIEGLSNVSDINLGNQYTQVRVGNDLFSFGPNADGRLFDGTTTTNRLVPFRAVMDNIPGNVRDMSGNSENSFILSADGTTVCGVGRSTLNNQSFGTFFPTSGGASTVVVRATPATQWGFTPPEPR